MKELLPRAAAVCIILLLFGAVRAQTPRHVFASLTGNPIKLDGWVLAGDASLAGKYGGRFTDGEIMLCPVNNKFIEGNSGAIFYKTAINLTECTRWKAEFEFRMWDGAGKGQNGFSTPVADGIAFCFLENYPKGFVTGQGLGIDPEEKGLKIGFDTWLNYTGEGEVPKLEIRYGNGYHELLSVQKEKLNGGGATWTKVDALRNSEYQKAVIDYDEGDVSITVADNTYKLPEKVTFDFAGYLGFSASTGEGQDNHSIRNVELYIDAPPSRPGPAILTCSGEPAQMGEPAVNPRYKFRWFPTDGLSDPTSPNPVLNYVNETNEDYVRKYYISTNYNNSKICESVDSVVVRVRPQPKLKLTADKTSVCAGTPIKFTADIKNEGDNPVIEWYKNGTLIPSFTAKEYIIADPNDGDKVWMIIGGTACTRRLTSDTIELKVTGKLAPTLEIAADQVRVCSGTTVTFKATAKNAGDNPAITWKKNGRVVGNSSDTYIDNALNNGDVITAEMRISNGCFTANAAQSNTVTMEVGNTAITKPNIGNDTTVCTGVPLTLNAGSGYAKYLWKDGSTAQTLGITEPGTYWVKVTDACGNTESDSVTVTANPAKPFDLGADLSTCPGDSVVLTGPAGYATYNWSPATAASATAGQTIKVAPASDARYTLTVTNANGCTTTDDIGVQITKNPTMTLGPDTAFCAGAAVTLRPSLQAAGGQYLWSTGATSATIDVRTTGKYWVQVKSSCASLSDTVLITSKEFPVVDLGRDTGFCGNANLILQSRTSSPGVEWNWSNGSSAASLAISKSGSYWLEANLDGCRKRDTVTVDMWPIPNVKIQPRTFFSICRGSKISVLASGANNYVWNNGSQGAGISVGDTGWVSVQGVDARGCRAKDSAYVRWAIPAPVFAGPDTSMCAPGGRYTLFASGGSKYLWSPANYLNDPTSATPTASITKTTTFTVTVVDDSTGCNRGKQDQVTVTIAPPVAANAGKDAVLNLGAQFQLRATGGVKYLWSPATGLSNPNIANPVADVKQHIDYVVKVWDAQNCFATDTIRIKAYKGPEIYVPTAFTPNGDGRNDKLTPIIVGYKTMKLFQVFNRWGEVVFQTSEPDHGWDGNVKGQTQTTAVYVWQLTAERFDGSTISQKGTVTLIR